MQKAIAECAARAAKFRAVPAGVVTSVDRPTARQAMLYSDPALWRGMAAVRREVAEDNRREGQVPLSDRNHLIANFYESVGRLPRVPGPPEGDLAPERPVLAAPAGAPKKAPTLQLAPALPIPVAAGGSGLLAALAVALGHAGSALRGALEWAQDRLLPPGSRRGASE